MKPSNKTKKLFISDLDGTLLKIGNEFSAGISEENRKAILSFVEQGNIFAIASARDLNYLDEVEMILGFRPDFIGQNGTAMYYGGHTSMKTIDTALFEELCNYCKEHDMRVTIAFHMKEGNPYVVDRIYYPYNVETALHDAAFMDSFHKRMPKDLTVADINGITVFVEPQRLNEVRACLKEHFQGRLEVVSSDIDLINVSPYGCTKGNGVKELMQYYGLGPDDVATIGDSDNDISMLQAVSFSYCMDHSEPEVKEAASMCVESVAQAMEHFTKRQ